MSTTPSRSSGSGARYKSPQRDQVEWRPAALNELLPPEHLARTVWQFCQSLDLSPLYGQIRAVAGGPGRPAVDPQLLLALWLFATLESIGSARQLEKLCERDLAYLWLCGGVGVNHHLLADFRSEQGDFLDDLLTKSIALLLDQGLVTLDRVAQDGLKVRAAAGTSSFRRRPTLEQRLKEAREHVERLKSQQEEDPAASDQRRQAAQQRAAKDRTARIKKALAELEQLEAKKRSKTAAEPRASLTDGEARRMKMADGGFRPAYNIQLATDGATRLIVGVSATNEGNDHGQLGPMHTQLATRYGKTPKEYLVDGGFSSNEDLALLEERGTTVYAPIHAEAAIRRRGGDPYQQKKDDNPARVRFRQRMSTPEAQAIYKTRSSIAEFPNAEFRNHGLYQLPVRGLVKAKSLALWHALAFNFMRMRTLKWLPT